MGFPPRAWFDVERLARQYRGVGTLLIDNVVKWDPEYFEDFWTVPGYLGFDPPESLARARVLVKSTVTDVVMRDEAIALGLPLPRLLNVAPLAETAVAVRVEGLSATNLDGATLTVTGGIASGRVLSVVDVVDGVVVTGFGPDNSQGLTGGPGRRPGRGDRHRHIRLRPAGHLLPGSVGHFPASRQPPHPPHPHPQPGQNPRHRPAVT
jgi:hypothetical protein